MFGIIGMTKKKFYIRVLFLIIPPLLIIAFIIFYKYVIELAGIIPACPFYALFHKLCPACGNTRAVLALARGDIVASLRCNITIMFLFLLGGAFYIENIAALLKRNVKIVPRGSKFIYFCLAFFVAYYVSRNFIPIFMPV